MEQKTENTNPVIFGVGTSSLQMVEQAIKSQSTNALNIHSGNSQRLGFMSTNVTATQRSTIENKSRTFVQKTVDIIRNKRQKNREETIFDQSAVIVAQLLEKGRKELTGKKKIKNEAIFHLTQEIIVKQLDKFNQQLDNVEASKQIMKKLNNSHTKHLQEIFSAREEEAQLTKELKEQGVEVDKMTLFFDTSDLNEEEEDNEVQKSIEVNDEDEEEDEEEEEEEQTRHKRKRNTVQQQKPIKRPRTQ
ncbi:MAG: hypothetical protein EZS28_005716 [Streblomastix strix]|uniref:Uncharacterized protein n=1 Tax=Streblomastix strix TaxID=222440 RepID=A0A5J4WW79_9EUKA|nr:MAG: hypothetical protein EZS28_005716 [Streblomastix strix]